MFQADAQSRLYCSHYVPSDIDCPDCQSIEKDYLNRPLYAPLFVPLPNLPAIIDDSQLRLPKTFYKSSNRKHSEDCVEIKTKNGIVRVPRSALVHRSRLDESTAHSSNQCPKETSACPSQQTFPGDFQKHAHRYTRSFSWKTKPEESPFLHMQPLPKLIKRPDYIEICCKNICWPTHQFCLCCGRNTAESCRTWSKSKGEYNYVDACRSLCALCSDDAYKIFNTPVVYHEKIIDPEVLLPLDAELLYYSIQSAKRQQEKQQNSSSLTALVQPQSQMRENQKQDIVPFADIGIDLEKPTPTFQNQEKRKKKKKKKKKRTKKKEKKTKKKGKGKKKRKGKSKKGKAKKKKPTKKSSASRKRSKKKLRRSKSRSKKKSKSKA